MRTASSASLGDVLSDNSDESAPSVTNKGVGKNACVFAENNSAAIANGSRAR
ncbi:hypothetical protein [Psychrobacter sp. KH172YL61]|uniref:hypothetical protein n=1 Tax=Psychrobacter sp. KH172YL61 TaxID=2517899 RepID=UPI001F07A354|nr:hypothetical protein [Psychrobacter sp. KH172YL61]